MENIKIIDIKFERIFLKYILEISNESELPNLVITNGNINISVDDRVEKIGSNKYSITINLAAANNRSFLENGEWKLCICKGKEKIDIRVDSALYENIENIQNVYRYGNDKYAYAITFHIFEIKDYTLGTYFKSTFLQENKNWQKRKYMHEVSSFSKKVVRGCMGIFIKCMAATYYILSHIFPKTGKNILFMTENKTSLTGNLQYIYERMIERRLNEDFKVTCSCRKSKASIKEMLSWIKVIWLISKQDFIFIDDYCEVFGFFKLHPKTKLIQVWHAGEGFKSVGYSRFGKNGSPFPARSSHKAYTYALTGSNNLIKVYSEVFGIEEEAILPLGMARLDGFLSEEKIRDFKKEFYKEYPSLENKKIVLFAPTFRGTGRENAYYDYDKLDLEKIYKFCDNQWIFLVKMHPFVDKPIEIPEEYQDKIIDFTKYPNINDLYYVTDVLITDYSSNYYEYALLKKPVLFYTYDREFYELTRGVHRNVKNHAPGKVCDTFDELITALKNEDYEIEKLDKFVEENFSEYDGHASDRVIDQILLGKDE